MTAVEIADLRRNAGLSQSELARRLGVSTHTVQNWEQGIRRPSGPAVEILKQIEGGKRK